MKVLNCALTFSDLNQTKILPEKLKSHVMCMNSVFLVPIDKKSRGNAVKTALKGIRFTLIHWVRYCCFVVCEPI